MSPELKSTSSGRHALVTLAGQWTKYLVQLLSLVVFSRLLTPSDLGIIAMVTAIASAAYVVGDFGLSLAAVQAKTLSQNQKSNLFWINSSLGAVVALSLASLSGPISTFYDEPAVVSITLWISLIFIFNGIAVQFRAELNRHLRFAALAGIDALSQASGFIVAVVVAIAGFGYWSLVVLQLLSSLIALAMAVTLAHWMPGLPHKKSSMKKLLSFGAFTFAAQIVNYLSANIDSMLIGRFWGPAALGFYNRAYQIAFAPTLQVATPLTRVLLPILTQRLDDRLLFSQSIRKCQALLAYTILGLLSLLAGTAQSLVPFVLGPGWADSVPLLRVLAIAGAFQAMGYVFYWILLAQGKTKLLFYSELGARVAMVALMISLVQFGSIWVAWAAAIGQLFLLVSSAMIAMPRVGLPMTLLAGVTIRPVVTFATSAGAAWAAGTASHGDHNILTSLLTGVGAWLAVAAVIALAFRPVRKDFLMIVQFGRSAVSRRQSS